jgi:pimeloyl-ACP methyl ester carboxylesterase
LISPSASADVVETIKRMTLRHSAADVATGAKVSAMQTKLPRHGDLQILPDCGHYVSLERPDILNGT